MSFSLAGYNVVQPRQSGDGSKPFLQGMESIAKLSVMRREQERQTQEMLMKQEEHRNKMDTLAKRNQIIGDTAKQMEEERGAKGGIDVDTNKSGFEGSITLGGEVKQVTSEPAKPMLPLSEQFGRYGGALAKGGDFEGATALYDLQGKAKQNEIHFQKIQGEQLGQLTKQMDDYFINFVNPETGKLNKKSAVEAWPEQKERLKQIYPENMINAIDPSKVEVYKGQIFTTPLPGSEDKNGKPQQIIVSQHGKDGFIIVATGDLQAYLRSISAQGAQGGKGAASRLNQDAAKIADQIRATTDKLAAIKRDIPINRKGTKDAIDLYEKDLVNAKARYKELTGEDYDVAMGEATKTGGVNITPSMIEQYKEKGKK